MNITKNQLKTPLLTGQSVTEKRAELKSYFRNSWQTYESLFSLINDDSAYYLRPEPLRHPLVFYYGHTATFFINKLILGKYISQRINQKLEAICAVGVDEMSWDDLNSEHYDWPAIDEVRAYRMQVVNLVDELIDTMELTLPIQQDSLAWVILMGCEHERIHLETSSVIMRMLPLQYLTKTAAWQACPFTDKAPENQLLPVAGKHLLLGKPESDHTYGWDNEYGKEALEVPSFSASKYLVSNQEFKSFVDAGGYQQSHYWTEEGQRWLAFTQATMPRFWLNKGQQLLQRNLLEEIPLPLDWPVDVNYLEAKAFCNWKSEQQQQNIRLPSEAEWYCLRDKIDIDLPQWQEAPGNTNLEYFSSSCPVNRFEADGFFDVLGNVWQWTESAIDGYTGFSVHPLYDDFSTPTFDGQHNLIKGGSWISTGNEAIKHSRYAFRRHFFQHAGFRYVQSDASDIPQIPANHYENDVDICQQLACHYGESLLGHENYASQLAQTVLNYTQQYQPNSSRLLDLGCNVGRISFELAQHFDHVDGVDFSARYIQYGVQLQQQLPVRYLIENEGDIVDYNEVELSTLNLAQTANKVHFSQGDISNLKSIYTQYDVVLVQGVLEKSYHPALFLNTVHQRLTPNGLLVVVSDYHFDEAQTDKSKWLGGIKINGENVTGFDGLYHKLNEKFELLAQQELTRVLKLNNRKFEMSTPHLTVWKLKD
ncbi:5-histidylcysteine sulfoxide synthase [Colwelliaceae bacterium 6471]